MEWIRINKTAPVDGQQILAYTQKGVVVGFWVEHENGVCDEPDGVGDSKWAFTHWMPVPEPPAEEKAGAGQRTTSASTPLPAAVCEHGLPMGMMCDKCGRGDGLVG